MIIETPEVPAGRSLLAHHTFSCPLPTRGGVCDCLPGPEDPGGEPATAAALDAREPTTDPS